MKKTMTSVAQVLVDQIKDLYSAESQIVKALPKMMKAATSPDLKQGFQLHLEQTKEQIERLKSICEELEVKPTGKKCMATAGLVEEGQEAIDESAEPAMKDLLLIAAAQRVEHYEIAAYTSAIAMAKALDLTSLVKKLSATLAEEKATDEKLTKLNEPALRQATAAQARA